MTLLKKYNGQLIALLVTVLAASIFFGIYETSDIILHIKFAKEYINNGNLPANFLYYWSISELAFKDEAFLMYSSIIVLTIMVLGKYLATKLVLSHFVENKDQLTLNLMALCLILVSSIYIPQLFVKRIYLGSFTPTIWLNSTTVAVVPFALLLFWTTVKQLTQFSWVRLLIIVALIGLNLIIKPSYLLVYVGALPFTYLVTRGISKDIFLQSLPLFITVAFIYIQKILIYDTQGVYSDSTIELGFLKAYKAWHEFQMTPLILFFMASLLTSLAFPIYVLYKKGMNRTDTPFIFAWISIIGALAIFVFISETGSRSTHGNFIWQVYISVFILFVVSVAKTYKELTSFSRRPNLFQIIFGLHVIMGGLYALKLIVL